MMLRFFTENPKDDPKDFYDNLKWDIPETSLIHVYVDNYLYKVKNTPTYPNAVNKLVYTRKEIDRLCNALEQDYLQNSNKYNQETRNNIQLFLEIHQPNSMKTVFEKKYFYLLSEIPKENRDFEGLNKPRGRFLCRDAISIGPDKNLRASYKDIFLTLSLDKKKYKELVLHELAHTGCNHIIWRDDDHNGDFKNFYRILDRLANEIGFLSF